MENVLLESKEAVFLFHYLIMRPTVFSAPLEVSTSKLWCKGRRQIWKKIIESCERITNVSRLMSNFFFRVRQSDPRPPNSNGQLKRDLVMT